MGILELFTWMDWFLECEGGSRQLLVKLWSSYHIFCLFVSGVHLFKVCSNCCLHLQQLHSQYWHLGYNCTVISFVLCLTGWMVFWQFLSFHVLVGLCSYYLNIWVICMAQWLILNIKTCSITSDWFLKLQMIVNQKYWCPCWVFPEFPLWSIVTWSLLENLYFYQTFHVSLPCLQCCL